MTLDSTHSTFSWNLLNFIHFELNVSGGWTALFGLRVDKFGQTQILHMGANNSGS